MALVLKDRVRETSTTTGTGTFTLAGAVAGFQSFSAIGTGNSTYYTIVSTSDWEVGIGTWTSPDQLSRDTVLASTNAGALVTFGSGTKDVFLTFPAEGFAVPPAIGGTTPNTITGTTVSATTLMTLPTITVGNVGTGVLQMIDGLDGYDYLNIYTYDPAGNVPARFPAGIQVTGSIDIGTGIYTGGNAFFLGAGSGISGNIALRGGTVANDITIQAPASPSAYTLTLPTTAGSNNQVLKTDGTGVLSWVTPNAGTVTSVGGTGTVNGLTLTGTVTGSGNLTLGGTLSLVSPPAIGSTTPNTGSFTTLSATSIDNTSSIARSGGKTSVVSVLNQATFTTGGTTLASQTAAANATWRIRAFGTFAAQTNVTARTAQVAVFWGNTQLGAITPSVLVSVTQITQWQVEFTVTASSTTAVWTAGTLLNRIASATALAVDTVTPASTTVTAGAQTIDLRFRVSTAVASEGWNVQSVTIERLV